LEVAGGLFYFFRADWGFGAFTKGGKTVWPFGLDLAGAGFVGKI
jgi:hypothetical protein